jgi:hypothetical protein
MAKRHTRNRRRIARRRSRKMVGGDFTQQQLQQLQQTFTQNQINSLDQLGVSYNQIIQKINMIRNGGIVDPDDIAEQAMVEFLNENIFDNQDGNIAPIAHEDEEHHMDVGDLDLSMHSDDGSLHLSDLDATQNSMDANTTLPDDSLDFGNTSNISNFSNQSNMSGNESVASEMGGKKRRRKSSKKRAKKGKKTRKQRGGTCYGTGVGANSFDPNLSIYNTNMLKLFPYKPTN